MTRGTTCLVCPKRLKVGAERYLIVGYVDPKLPKHKGWLCPRCYGQIMQVAGKKMLDSPPAQADT